MFGWFKERKKHSDRDSALNIASGLLAVQLAPKFQRPQDAFSTLMTNKVAAGYVFGFHDSMLQRLGLVDPAHPENGATLMKASYQNIFGESAGFALLSMSMNLQSEPSFIKGRMNGGEEFVSFAENKTPPMGLGRMLILGLEG